MGFFRRLLNCFQSLEKLVRLLINDLHVIRYFHTTWSGSGSYRRMNNLWLACNDGRRCRNSACGRRLLDSGGLRSSRFHFFRRGNVLLNQWLFAVTRFWHVFRLLMVIFATTSASRAALAEEGEHDDDLTGKLLRSDWSGELYFHSVQNDTKALRIRFGLVPVSAVHWCLISAGDDPLLPTNVSVSFKCVTTRSAGQDSRVCWAVLFIHSAPTSGLRCQLGRKEKQAGPRWVKLMMEALRWINNPRAIDVIDIFSITAGRL